MSFNLARVHERIVASGREVQGVRVVAVTKTFGIGEVSAALHVGLTHFGENYVDELCEKKVAVTVPEVSWHFLGALQSRKIARITKCADIISTVAREKELLAIAALSPRTSIDVQVDFTGDAHRNGLAPDQVSTFVARARSLEVHVRGLMVVAPRGVDAAREAFSHTRALADDLELVERSMGMSDDLEMACELGSTEVRLGRALFGPRVSRGHLT